MSRIKKILLEIRIYSKNDLLTDKLFPIIGIIVICLSGSIYIFDFDKSTMSYDIMYILIILALVFVILDLTRTIHYFGPKGKVSKLIVYDSYISFLGKHIDYTQIERVIVRISDTEVKYNHISNNYMEIKTKDGNKNKLAVLIEGNKDLDKIEQIIKILKEKVSNVIYE